MNATTLQVLVASAEQEVFRGTATQLVVASDNGELMVLPGHAPLLAHLRPGILRIEGSEQSRDNASACVQIVIIGGYIEVQPDAVTILADAVERSDDIDQAHAAKAVEQAKQQVASANPIGVDRAIMELELATARLKLAKRKHPTPSP